MDISNKFLMLPKSVTRTYFETDERVIIEGDIDPTLFQKNFEEAIKSETLNSEKAVYVAMQTPQRPLPSIEMMLYHL